MKLNHFIGTCIVILCCIVSACSSSDDEPGKIVIPEDQPTSIAVPANQSGGQIRFTAASSWSAWTSTESRGINDVEWIHLEDTNGSAGEVYLNFSLDYNNTGESRTAYIIITCEDTRIVITVTQTAEDDPDIHTGTVAYDGYVEIEVKRYEGVNFDGTSNYELSYSNGLPVQMTSKWRDDMVSDQDSYCLSTETTRFSWDGYDRTDIKSVKVDMQTEVVYYPSESKEIEDPSEHYAEIKDGRAVSGWYWWTSEDTRRSEWTATYNASGYLTSSKNNDASDVWDTHSMTWSDGNLTKIVCEGESGRNITITYADESLLNLHQEFDVNWVLPTELECYDFAAGDISKVFASIGLMGNPSKNLITAITEYDGHNTYYSYRMDYKTNTKDETIVTVMHFINDVQTSYSEWTIKYTNIN